jgi:oligosaccharide repeat unit polymerase
VTHSSIIAALFVIFSLIILLWQYFADGKRIDLFNPKTLFQIYFILLLPLNLFLGVSYNLDNFLVLSPDTPEEDVILLGFTFLVAHLVVVITYYNFGKSCLPFPRILSKKWIYGRVKLLSVIYYIIGYISFFIFLRNNGGYRNFTENVEYFRAHGISSQGLIVFLSTSLPVIAGMALAISFSRKGKLTLLKIAILVVASVFPASQMGFRTTLLSPFFQMFFIYNFRVRKIYLSYFIFIVLFLSIIFTVYGTYRETRYLMVDGFDFDTFYKSILSSPELLFATFLRAKGADIVAEVIRTDFTNGNFFILSIIEVLTIFMPRSLWEGKPISGAIEFSKLLDKSGGVPPTVVGEGYWNAGYIGIIVIMLVMGIILRLYQNRLEKSWDNDSFILVSSMAFPYLFLMAEAPQIYLNAIVTVMVFLIPLLLSFSVRFNLSSTRNRVHRV